MRRFLVVQSKVHRLLMGVLCVLTVTNFHPPKELSHIFDELHGFSINLYDPNIDIARLSVC